MTDNVRYTPEAEALIDLKEMVALKRKAGDKVEPVAEAPLHWPGVDDKANRFQWWEWRKKNEQGKLVVEGYFHTPKGIVL